MSRRRGPRSTTDRLRRLLIMLPWIMERGTAPLSEMASTFGLSEAELVKDLELVACCGLPPFLDEMVDVFIDEGTVFVGIPRFFTRPLRLTAPEGFALLAAARVSIDLPGFDAGGPLARALRKLEAVLGSDALVVDEDRPAVTDDVVSAISAGERLRMRYRTGELGEVNEREVSPRLVFADRGNWYLIADDHLRGEERVFRIDRIDSIERTGEIDPPRAVAAPSGDDWFRDSDLPVVKVRLDDAATWVTERYPLRSCQDEGEHTLVGLTVADENWFDNLLLRLGRHAEVVEPADRAGRAREVAAALLERYERDEP
ncbi:MAG: putative proteasome accessory factor [Actinomycetota bacterium]